MTFRPVSDEQVLSQRGVRTKPNELVTRLETLPGAESGGLR